MRHDHLDLMRPGNGRRFLAGVATEIALAIVLMALGWGIAELGLILWAR